MFCRSKFGHCLRAPITNGLYEMAEKKNTMEFLQSGAQRVQLLKHYSRLVEVVMRTVGMQRVKIPN